MTNIWKYTVIFFHCPTLVLFPAWQYQKVEADILNDSPDIQYDLEKYSVGLWKTCMDHWTNGNENSDETYTGIKGISPGECQDIPW